jgi:hypothetical protein
VFDSLVNDPGIQVKSIRSAGQTQTSSSHYDNADAPLAADHSPQTTKYKTTATSDTSRAETNATERFDLDKVYAALGFLREPLFQNIKRHAWFILGTTDH